MSAEVEEFSVRVGAIEGLLIVTMKQVTDERGTIRELFRRSAFEAAAIPVGGFAQLNVTESKRGAVRGMHAEAMTKLLAVAEGRALGAYLDVRPDSPTRGRLETVDLRPGVQVLVPSGVANGFQALSERTQYVYCFDREWRPDMPGSSCNPLDPDLAIPWPIPVDRDAPMFAELDREIRS
jgi:dTDP-4-dehydrorhamnose 3,5-epimerase